MLLKGFKGFKGVIGVGGVNLGKIIVTFFYVRQNDIFAKKKVMRGWFCCCVTGKKKVREKKNIVWKRARCTSSHWISNGTLIDVHNMGRGGLK